MPKKMRTSLTDRLLLLLADSVDLYWMLTSVSRAQRAMSGDPRWRKERHRLEQKLRRKVKPGQCRRALRLLIRRGFLHRRTGTLEGYFVTAKGERRVLRLQIVDSSSRYKKLGAEQSLMVLFDIPEEHRRQRDLFRRSLRSLFFIPFQRSIWITRYDVGTAVQRLITQFRLQPYVQVLVVRQISKRKMINYNK